MQGLDPTGANKPGKGYVIPPLWAKDFLYRNIYFFTSCRLACRDNPIRGLTGYLLVGSR
jgi:hypothetical protein